MKLGLNYDGLVINLKSACQQVESDSEINPEHNELHMDAVTDLLPASAKALGSHFALIFAILFDPLMDFVRESNSPLQNIMQQQ
ncbi:hypothetical protein Ccrd_017322 [Cynara cardunculus var. scolymus]|uniref:Uncharacterized protein n=1 Tax=Cynara cardunculus var. scolymus TaxID=59895 RepID=A0A118K2I0_CYNCS|nr:hypothetical protein Ccrd_017322 [Cynara cardunculus var. scolymus]